MTTPEPARGRTQRRQDTLDRLEKDDDAWFASASADGEPCLVPLSFVWLEGDLVICTRRTNPTARNLTPTGRVRVTLGHTRDVVLIEGTAELVADDGSPRLPTPSPPSWSGTRAPRSRMCTCA